MHPITLPLMGLLAAYLFIYVFALPLVAFDRVPSWGTWMGGVLNLLQGTLTGLWLMGNAGRRGALAALLILGLAWAVEHIGVTRGVPFGRYVYTDTLGARMAGAVPWPIPWAWLLLIPATLGTARLLVGRQAARPGALLLIAPLLALLYDLALEPFATTIMGYWRWIERGPLHGVPTVNYLAWYGTALLLSGVTLALCRRAIIVPRLLPRLPLLLYSLNLLLVALVDLAHGYVGIGLFGLAALALGGWRLRRELAALPGELRHAGARAMRLTRPPGTFLSGGGDAGDVRASDPSAH